MKPCRRPPLTIPIVVLAAVQPASAQLPEGPTWTAEGAQSGARFGVAVASAGDVNGNGVDDEDEVAGGSAADCNANGVPDSCDVAAGTSADVNGNGVPDECECVRSSYCVGAPNSLGPGGSITATGSSSVGQNDLVLWASVVPPGQPGLFYYGPDALQVPFGDGFRCVGGGVTRLDVVLIDSFATAMFALDLAGLPPAGSPIDPGSTWRFQFWYRDPQGGPAGFNLTDALAVTFCD